MKWIADYRLRSFMRRQPEASVIAKEVELTSSAYPFRQMAEGRAGRGGILRPESRVVIAENWKIEGTLDRWGFGWTFLLEALG